MDVSKEQSMLLQKQMIGDHYDRLAEGAHKVVYTFVPGNLNELVRSFGLLPYSLLRLLLRCLFVEDHLVDDPVFLGFAGAHEVVPIGVLLDALELALSVSLNYAGPHLGQFVLPAPTV